MPSQGSRTAMLLGGALIAGVAGTGAAAANTPDFADAVPLGTEINLTDTARNQNVPEPPRLDLSITDGSARFSSFNNQFTESSDFDQDRRAVEFEVSAGHALTGIPLDVSIAQRASFGAEDGDINRHSRGSEVRIGRAFGDPDSGMTMEESRIYVFAASDNEALTWRPGQELTNFSLVRDTVQVGDMQAGITYQRGPLQASFAYVEREITARVGRDEYSDNERFAGFTLTMKR